MSNKLHSDPLRVSCLEFHDVCLRRGQPCFAFIRSICFPRRTSWCLAGDYCVAMDTHLWSTWILPSVPTPSSGQVWLLFFGGSTEVWWQPRNSMEAGRLPWRPMVFIPSFVDAKEEREGRTIWRISTFRKQSIRSLSCGFNCEQHELLPGNLCKGVRWLARLFMSSLPAIYQTYEPRKKKFVQIPFIADRKATNSFTHKRYKILFWNHNGLCDAE